MSLWIGLFETTEPIFFKKKKKKFDTYMRPPIFFFKKKKRIITICLPCSWRPILEPTRVDNKTLPSFLVPGKKSSTSKRQYKVRG